MHGSFEDMSDDNLRDESRLYERAKWDHYRQMQGQVWPESHSFIFSKCYPFVVCRFTIIHQKSKSYLRQLLIYTI